MIYKKNARLNEQVSIFNTKQIIVNYYRRLLKISGL